ncbi:DUF3298 and DUF4163 domain-containing protein [Ruminococcus sp. OA3]|uniref:DUF3298 and DUF4163 domain-containing protein n=1 Tax=Ruminococcus sp. OA3 TaxID=2914164 RepID=UPI001F0682F5|nr:DUF3298 and DUF4163 domain-containing protein [Ruminococcus sp. OA3]MCH1982501.1 DUF3298 and DUF4163 domain-containing protein [Ruminococcus sp. OA3]
MQAISNMTLENTMYYRDIPVFVYQINYPVFSTSCRLKAAREINEYYASAAKDLEFYCRTTLYPRAVENARYIPSNRPPFNSYELIVKYQVPYNINCITSLYFDQYTFMGGAHGETLRKSNTWDFCSGRQLQLADFYPRVSTSPETLFKELERQTAERLLTSPASYFDNYAELLRKNFRPENFYLKPEGIVIYYQQYDIAPYASGIPEFLIP